MKTALEQLKEWIAEEMDKNNGSVISFTPIDIILKIQSLLPVEKEQYVDFAKWIRDNTVADGAPKLIYMPTKERMKIEQLFDTYTK